MVANIGLGKQVGLLLGLLAVVGCSRPVDYRPTPAEERLTRIGRAYIEACNDLKRAPTSFEEIKPYITGDFSDELLHSPNDGEAFVILWGVDFNTLPPGREDPFTVGAYEKHGVGGKRWVLRFPIGVLTMTDEAFRKAVFPPGHAPSP